MTRNLLDFTKDNQLAILVLNNPPNNLLNDHLLTSLESNIKIAEENGYRAILLRSKLNHFFCLLIELKKNINWPCLLI